MCSVTCIYCYGRIIHTAYVCKAQLANAVASKVHDNDDDHDDDDDDDDNDDDNDDDEVHPVRVIF